MVSMFSMIPVSDMGRQENREHFRRATAQAVGEKQSCPVTMDCVPSAIQNRSKISREHLELPMITNAIHTAHEM
jgi:hypothetical protein